MSSDPSPVSFSWSARVRSFRFAARGLCVLFATQHNARLHLAAMVLVVAAGLLFGLTRLEWVAVTTAIAMVLISEAFNTAVERLGDAITREVHPAIADAKDLAAAAVLLASITAVIIGLVIFLPYAFSVVIDFDAAGQAVD